MLALGLYLFLIWLILLAVFWGGGLYLQAYLYSEPEEQLAWRAPVAATVLLAFYTGWCLLAQQYPGRHDTLLRFNPVEEAQFKQFWIEEDGKRVEYQERLVTQGNMPAISEYVEAQPPYRPWQRSGSIIIKEEGKEVVFKAPRDANNRFVLGPGGVLVYRDEQGRTMSEQALGVVSVFRWDVIFLNLVINLLHVGLWFVCCWVVLRFQWGHALGLALAGTALMTIVVLPALFDRAMAAGAKTPVAVVRAHAAMNRPGAV